MDADAGQGTKSPIVSPKQLHGMPASGLRRLASRIRERLIDVVAANGGHLAPNLGVVELTLALHAVFDSPNDKIIWDVGHQSYVHKMLTGRWDELDSLRRSGGLSGFPRRSESEHDVFETGHASTSISAALGLAKARDLLAGSGHAVAVIGDGSLTGGMAFEALNYAGQAQTSVVVVLNDNSMSISRSVGGLAAYLGRVRTHPLYSRTKQDIKALLDRLPGGPSVAGALGRLRTSLKYLLIPGILFEELGLTYLGPVDGHDLAALTTVLRQAKQMTGPVIVHCLTKKGQGYVPAEFNPNRFHGIGPFDRESGESRSPADAPPSYSDVFGLHLTELARADRRICAITAAMPDGTGLRPFALAHPGRLFDVGIAEQHAVTMAAGLAAGGARPVVAVYSTFLQRAYDQILHDVCLQGLPVVLALDRAGLVGEDGPTHHGAYDLAYLRQMPGLKLAVPRDAATLRLLLDLALESAGPFALRYPRGRTPAAFLPADVQLLRAGRGEILRSGADVAILAVGPVVYEALRAAETLAAEGVDVAVADARWVKPLDSELVLRLAAATGRVLTLEDGVASGGFGSAVLELLAVSGQAPGAGPVTVRVRGLPDEPVPHGREADQRRAVGLDAAGIRAAVLEMVRPR